MNDRHARIKDGLREGVPPVGAIAVCSTCELPSMVAQANGHRYLRKLSTEEDESVRASRTWRAVQLVLRLKPS